jgi:hypothetical protein
MIIRWSFLALLFVVPFIYSVWKGNFKRCFWFTWIVWSVVVFVYGIFNPAIAHIVEKATGESPDISCGGFVFGIVLGWLPGLIIAPLGCFLHDLLCKRK